jgi:hypothetical protein
VQARPSSLAEVAVRADSLERFGRELADWLHTLRALGSRPALALLAGLVLQRRTGLARTVVRKLLTAQSPVRAARLSARF